MESRFIKKIYEGNTRVVIPNKAEASRKKQQLKNKNKSGKRQEIINSKKQNKNKTQNKTKRIKKHQFKYISKIDAYECPKTKELLTVTIIVGKDGKQKKKYSNKYCITCKYKSECTSQHSRVFYEDYDEVLEEIRKLYYSEEGQAIYLQRGHFAESSFAILLGSRNFRGIKTRGIEKANKELTDWEILHNIKKYEKHTTNKFLKLLLNSGKKYKQKHGKLDFSFIRKIREKLIIKNDVITGIRD